MERIVASYHVDGHDVGVVEMIDEDRAWLQWCIDGAMLPLDVQAQHLPDEQEAAAVLRAWLTRAE